MTEERGPAPGSDLAGQQAGQEVVAPEPDANEPPPGYVIDPISNQLRPMTFMEKARQAAGVAAGAAAKVSVEVGSQAAKAGAELSSKAAHQAATTIRDPATKARAHAALRKAKRGFTTALERIDPRILADVVVKATSLQEKANLSLRERGSAYRIGEITIGASIPPSIQFSIERIDDPAAMDSTTLIETAAVTGDPIEPGTIVTLDGTAIDDATMTEAAEEA
ncbi:MAG TPA: hypothetical protein VM451_01440 [Candidatus Limnocylindria bacterium]|nr:hypothetical protein [Candidatus Limnocylindria bacterium]